MAINPKNTVTTTLGKIDRPSSPVFNTYTYTYACLPACLPADLLRHHPCKSNRRRGRFFYRMVEGSTAQWILAFPTTKSPRTGDGLFPGEVIEVAQVLAAEDLTFLRLANNRGWTFARSPTDGSVLFEDFAGGLSEDKDVYSFPSGGRGVVPILHGPGLRTQTTVRIDLDVVRCSLNLFFGSLCLSLSRWRLFKRWST